jgi:dUTP pyrophosphatase
MRVKIAKINSEVQIPVYAKGGDAGFDLVVNNFKKLYEGTQELRISSYQPVLIEPGQRVLCGTGLKMQIPEGFELQIRSRSGTALKTGIVIANSPGTIDSGYRGEIGLILLNTTNEIVKLSIGDSLAQGVLTEFRQAQFIEVKEEDLTLTERGENGYGSTNKAVSKL